MAVFFEDVEQLAAFFGIGRDDVLQVFEQVDMVLEVGAVVRLFGVGLPVGQALGLMPFS